MQTTATCRAHPKRCWCRTEAGPIGQSMRSGGRKFALCARKDKTVSHLGHYNNFCQCFLKESQSVGGNVTTH